MFDATHAQIPMRISRSRTHAPCIVDSPDPAPTMQRESLAAPITLAFVVLATLIGAPAVALLTALGG